MLNYGPKRVSWCHGDLARWLQIESVCPWVHGDISTTFEESLEPGMHRGHSDLDVWRQNRFILDSKQMFAANLKKRPPGIPAASGSRVCVRRDEQPKHIMLRTTAVRHEHELTAFQILVTIYMIQTWKRTKLVFWIHCKHTVRVIYLSCMSFASLSFLLISSSANSFMVCLYTACLNWKSTSRLEPLKVFTIVPVKIFNW